MEPIANETWKSFQRSYYRARLLLLLASLGEAYVGQLARMLRIPHSRVLALLHGAPTRGYAVELSLVALELAREKPTPRGRAYEITSKGLRKARSVAAARGRRSTVPRSLRRALGGADGGWTVALEGRTGDWSSVTWSVGG